MGRKPNQYINAEINRIRRYLQDNINKNDQEIMQELGINHRRYYRYKEKIREQDIAVWKEMAKETFEERSKKIMDAIDFANKIDKEIAENSQDHKARIQAANQLIQNNVWAMQLLERGPRIMPKLEAKVIQIPNEQSAETSQESIRNQTV